MAQKLVGEANSLFVDECYEEALEKFDQAIQLDGSVSDYYSKRSNCRLKLDDFLGEWDTFCLSLFLYRCHARCCDGVQT
jgi:hypothetical protein